MLLSTASGYSASGRFLDPLQHRSNGGAGTGENGDRQIRQQRLSHRHGCLRQNDGITGLFSKGFKHPAGNRRYISFFIPVLEIRPCLFQQQDTQITVKTAFAGYRLEQRQRRRDGGRNTGRNQDTPAASASANRSARTVC